MRRDVAELNVKTMGEKRVALMVPRSHEAASGVLIARPVAAYSLDRLPLTIRKGECSEKERTTTRVRGNARNGDTADAALCNMYAHSLSCGVGNVGRGDQERATGKTRG